MKKCLLLLFLHTGLLQAQNLVPNGSFELHTGCPDDFDEINLATGWFCPQTANSTDFYHACADVNYCSTPQTGFGYSPPHCGQGMSGFYLWMDGGGFYREFISCRLDSSLVAGECYQLTLYVNLGNLCEKTTDAIGAYFSDTLMTHLDSATTLSLVPQVSNTPGVYFDTLSWTQVTGTFTAAGGENYLVIGNFKSDSATSVMPDTGWSFVYVFLDDVCLTRCGDVCPACNLTGIEENKSAETGVYPNPFADVLSIENAWQYRMIVLYDVSGKAVLQQNLDRSGTVSTATLPAGLYIYRLTTLDGKRVTGKLVKE